MQQAGAWGAAAPNVWKPMGLVIAVGVSIGLIVIGTALGLGLGIGLHNDNKNLTLVTTTSATTTTTTASIISTTTTVITNSTTTNTTTSATNTTVTTTTTAATTASITSGYQGSLSSSSAVYGGLNLSTANVTYEAIQVVVDAAGTYAFRSDSNSNLKFFGYLYNNSFSPVSPTTNLIAQADSNTGSTSFNLSTSLQPNIQYVLVVTTPNQSAAGLFNITATGPGNVTFLRRVPLSTTASYGTLATSGTDDVSNGFVSIDATNIIQGIDGISAKGYISQVSLSFFTAPSTTTPMIFVYVFNRTGSTSTFTPIVSYQIPYTSIITGTNGTQTMSLPINQLPVITGQYVGVGFGTGGGSLYALTTGSQFYSNTTVTNFFTVTTASYNDANTGFAFQFVVLITGLVFG